MSTVDTNIVDIYSLTSNCYHRIIERELYNPGGNLGGYVGLPYQEMKAVVVNSYQACGAFLQNVTYFPTELQERAMNQTLVWGAAPGNAPSLTLFGSADCLRAPFTKDCFSPRITEWANQISRADKQSSITLMIGLLTFSCIFGLATLTYKYRDKLPSLSFSNIFKRSNYEEIKPDVELGATINS